MLIFDKIYVISLLKKRPNKIQEFRDRCPKELNIEVYDAIDGSEQQLPLWWNDKLKGSYGCYLSHLNILKKISENNYYNVLILEDDAAFCDNFILKLKNVFNNIPNDWEQLYLGGQHLGNKQIINNYIIKGSNINRTHAYIIRNKNVSDKILSYIENKNFWIENLNKNKYHIDYAYGILHKKNLINAYASKPFLIGQKANKISDTGSQLSTVDRWWN